MTVTFSNSFEFMFLEPYRLGDCTIAASAHPHTLPAQVILYLAGLTHLSSCCEIGW